MYKKILYLLLAIVLLFAVFSTAYGADRPEVVETPVKQANIEPQTIQEYAKEQVIRVFGEHHWNSFNKIIKHESNWKHTAKNPNSSAIGLCQTMYSLHKDTLVDDFINKPEDQINWCIEYAQDRYGDPNKAWKFWQANKYW
jgi:hypothetical protein